MCSTVQNHPTFFVAGRAITVSHNSEVPEHSDQVKSPSLLPLTVQPKQVYALVVRGTPIGALTSHLLTATRLMMNHNAGMPRFVWTRKRYLGVNGRHVPRPSASAVVSNESCQLSSSFSDGLTVSFFCTRLAKSDDLITFIMQVQKNLLVQMSMADRNH